MKVAIYCRLSSEDRDKLSANDDSASIQNQKDMLIRHAICNGWDVFGIYSDDDFSGADRNRPDFNRLIKDAKDRRFDIVLCKSQSRFTRELELVEKYIHTLFPALGIRFVSLVDHADTDDRGNKKSRQINALVNEWFLEELSDSIKSVLTSRRKQGLHIGPFAPYGYRKDPKSKGHLMIDPEAASVVRKIYALFLAGNGRQAIARYLNESGIPNPTEYKRLHGLVRNKKRRSSPLWSCFTITSILTNEVYIGSMVQGKTGTASFRTRKKVSYPEDQWIIVTGTHEPIIDSETWNNTQAMIKSKSTASQKQPEGILARKVRCMNCGCGMHSVKNGEKRGFKCARHALSPDWCMGAYISLRKLERIVLAQLQMLNDELLDAQMLENGIQPFPDLLQPQTQMKAEISDLKHKIEGHQAVMKALYVQRLSQQIPENEFIQSMLQITDERNNAENQIAELMKQIAETETIRNLSAEKKTLISKYTGCETLTKEMAAALIDYVEVGKRDPATKTTPIVIHWNF